MGFVKREGTTWYYQTDLPQDPATGKRKRKKKRGFKTKREAEKSLAQLEAEVIQGTYLEPSKILYKDFLSDWMQTKSHCIGVQTAAVYRGYLKTRIIPALGNIPLMNLKAVHVQSYINSLIHKGLASKTIKKIHEIIRSSLEYASEFELIQKNVAIKIKLPKQQSLEKKV